MVNKWRVSPDTASACSLAGRQRALRIKWRTASLAAGWPFPSDWASDAVDRVCLDVVSGRNPVTSLGEFGAARAEAGVALPGTLHDLAALHAVSTAGHEGLIAPDPDVVPAHLVRATAIGWAEELDRQAVGREVEDPLTGLTTAAYLRTRLHEVYRAAVARRRAPNLDHALLTVTLDLTEDVVGYSRMMGMVVAADVLRSVFDSGETLTLLRGSTAAVLAGRDGSLDGRCELVRRLTNQRMRSDPDLRSCGPVRVRENRLPDEHGEACRLLADMS
ncbi:hypothetical protein [Parasphingorhabdus pacifica]